MTLPDRIDTEAELEDVLAEPSDDDVACVARLDGDILILGAGGKMGPSLARRVQRAVARSGRRQPRRRGVAVLVARRARRASRPTAFATLACDFPSPPDIAALPRFPNVLFLAGTEVRHDRSDRHHLGDQHRRAGARGRAFLRVAPGGVLDRQRLSAGAGQRAGPH